MMKGKGRGRGAGDSTLPFFFFLLPFRQTWPIGKGAGSMNIGRWWGETCTIWMNDGWMDGLVQRERANHLRDENYDNDDH